MTYQHIGNGPPAVQLQQPQPPRKSGKGLALLIGGLGLAIGLVIGCVGGFVIGSAGDATDEPQAAAVTTAPGQQPAKDAGPPTLAAGAAANVKTTSGDQLTVTIGEPKAPVPSGNMFSKPERGHFFSVKVTVEFKSGSSTYSATPTDFKLVTADGTLYQAEILSLVDDALQFVDLNAGQKATGLVVFDVPSAVKPGTGAKIQFDGSWSGKAAAFWTV
jgi:hypothetical protein